jgi:hypothetical protein
MPQTDQMQQRLDIYGELLDSVYLRRCWAGSSPEDHRAVMIGA